MIDTNRYSYFWLSTVSCGLIGVISLCLVGIWLVVPELKDFSSATMKFNTCVLFLLSTISILFYVRNKFSNDISYRYLSITFAIFVVFLSLATSVEYIFMTDFGIDQLLVKDDLNAESYLHPGRMSPLAAVYFLFLGLGILFLEVKFLNINLSACFLIPLFLFTILALVGYLFDYPSFYQINPYIRISWLSAGFLFVLCICLFVSPNRHPPIPIIVSSGLGGMTARSLLPVVLLIPIIVGLLWLYGRNHKLFNQEFGVSLFVILIIGIFLSSVVFISNKLDVLEKTGKEVFLREQSLKSRFVEVLHHAPIIIWGTDINGKFTFYEGKALEYLNYSADEFIGKDSFEVYKNDSESLHAIRKALQGHSLTTETKIMDRVYSTRYSPSKNDHGDIVGMFAISTDLTDLKEATDRAKTTDERIRTFTDVMPAMAFICNPQGEAIYFNKAWFNYTGSTPTESFKWAWIDFINPDAKDDVKVQWAHCVKNSEPFELEFLVKSETGEFRWHLGRAIPVFNSRQIVTEWYGTITEIHGQKLHQEKSELLAHKLTEALKSRDEFLSIASHELKTPLTSLRLQSQLFHRKIKKNDLSVFNQDNISQMISQTDTQVNRLIHLVDDMLDIARIRSGKLSIEKTDIDMSQTIIELVARMSEHFMAKFGAAPHLNISDNLKLVGDKLRIEQVLTNLLINALKYGNGKPISVSAFSSGDYITVVVEDQGIGIAAENMKKIFTKFERAVSHFDISGLGLGLYISKQIVEGHGGRIWAESIKDVGSKFFFELPKNTPKVKKEVSDEI